MFKGLNKGIGGVRLTGEVETDGIIGNVGHSICTQRRSKGKSVRRDIHDNMKKDIPIN